MKRFSLILLLIAVTGIYNLAQSRFNAGASFNLGMPVGSFSDIVKTGIGGSLIGEYSINSKVSLTLSVSYQNFDSNLDRIAAGGAAYDFSVNSIPILAGAKYFFNPAFFGTVEAGVHLYRVSADVYTGFAKESLSTSFTSKFGAGAGAGFRIQLAEQSVFELSGLINLVEDDLNSVLFRASIMILLDKL